MARRALLAGLLTCCLISARAAPAPSTASDYVRPPPSQPLSLDHALLRRQAPDSPHSPEQIHISLAGPGKVAISWVTHPDQEAAAAAGSAAVQAIVQATGTGSVGRKTDSEPCQLTRQAAGQPVVLLGTKPGEYSLNATGNTSCYTADKYSSGALHTVVVDGPQGAPLQPATRYYYRCGRPDLPGALSQELSFRTLPRGANGGAGGGLRLGLVGDLGQTADSAATLGHLAGAALDQVLLVGDLSYADGDQPRWDSWGRLVQNSTARVPWMFGVGNHEFEKLNGDRDTLAYESRFYLPYQEAGSPSPLFYSFEAANAHIVMLSSYSPYDAKSEQYAWLQRDLWSVNRTRTPWLIVTMHAPWYCTNEAHQGEGEDMRAAVEPLLFQYGTDLVVSGHVHAYERTSRVYDGLANKCAPVYINIGDGGNREGLARDWQSQAAWSAVRESSFGAGVLHIKDRHSAVWQWHRNQGDAHEVSDEVLIERDPTCPQPGAGAAAVPRSALLPRRAGPQEPVTA